MPPWAFAACCAATGVEVTLKAIAETPPSKIAVIDILFFKMGTTFPPHRCTVEFVLPA
jgi:hypothetical protein